MNKAGRPSPENLIMLVFLTFEALLFSLFTAIMFSIQIRGIYFDSTGIEDLKKENRTRLKGCRNLKKVFGSNVILLGWFSPFSKAPPKHDLDIAARSTCPV